MQSGTETLCNLPRKRCRHPPSHHGDKVDRRRKPPKVPNFSARAGIAIQGPAQADKNHPQAHIFLAQPDQNEPKSGLYPLFILERQEHPGQQTGCNHIGVIIKSQSIVDAVECIKAQLSESCHPGVDWLYVPPNGHTGHQHGEPLDKEKGPRTKDPGQRAEKRQIEVKVRSQMGLMKGQQHIAVCQAELTVFKEGVGVKAGRGRRSSAADDWPRNGCKQTTGDPSGHPSISICAQRAWPQVANLQESLK